MDLDIHKDPYRKYNKYEIARILGARALQIKYGAPIMIEIPKEEYTNKLLRPFDIARMEFEKGVIPITIKRHKQNQ